ncbi:MAG TPA: type II toxin-antitoxin system HicA family toxin [Candidatus Eremiobacteraeota bacterium]|nr:MAG: hypothetical protein BWY64_03027 [bacterium ADurb.Bin363]HPZ08655.1 type II toxin-antitoxin system HicA family toxin [Candidatus Eremiobacteraeota bacterium]
MSSPTISNRNLENALMKKGFEQRKDTHHRIYRFRYKGKKTDIRTKASHGKKDLTDNILKQIKDQLKFKDKKQLIDFINCPMTERDYIKYLISIQIIQEEQD